MKQYRVIFSPRAEAQLGNLYDYIAERGGEERAEGFIKGIIEFCEGFSTFPERGTQRDDLRKNLRTIGYERRATIAFSVQDDRVIIHGVFYGGQDYDSVIQDDEPYT